MSEIVMYGLSGSTPINVYVADANGNNETKIGEVTDDIPPSTVFSPPSSFYGIPRIMVILENSSGCRFFKILECMVGCDFSVTITPSIDITCDSCGPSTINVGNKNYKVFYFSSNNYSESSRTFTIENESSNLEFLLVGYGGGNGNTLNGGGAGQVYSGSGFFESGKTYSINYTSTAITLTNDVGYVMATALSGEDASMMSGGSSNSGSLGGIPYNSTYGGGGGGYSTNGNDATILSGGTGGGGYVPEAKYGISEIAKGGDGYGVESDEMLLDWGDGLHSGRLLTLVGGFAIVIPV